MSNAAPPAWVRKLSIPSGAWRCLVGLWGFAVYTATGTVRVWPARVKLAEATGQSPHAVAKQLRQLAALGWIRRPNVQGSTVFELAWLAPFAGEEVQDGPGPVQLGPDTERSDPGTAGSAPDTERSVVRIQDGPQTCSERSNDLARDVVEDATPLESSPDDSDTVPRSPTRSPGGPVGVARRASPGLTEAHPEHAQASLNRAQRRAPAKPGLTEFEQRVYDTGPAARIALNWARWTDAMVEARAALTLTDDEIVAVLDAWHAAGRGERPDMNALWWGKSRTWVKGVLGIKPRGKALAPGQQTPAEIEAFIKRSSMGARP